MADLMVSHSVGQTADLKAVMMAAWTVLKSVGSLAAEMAEDLADRKGALRADWKAEQLAPSSVATMGGY